VGGKLNKPISIRPKLDLSPYASPNLQNAKLSYRLVSLVTHIGASQHCGHYTAIGLTETGNYYQFDDSFVRPISVANVMDTQAYLLFFELEDAPIAAKTQQETNPKPFIGPQLPQSESPKPQRQLVDVRPSTSKVILNGTAIANGTNSKLVNNILSGNKVFSNGTKLVQNGGQPKTNGFHRPTPKSPVVVSPKPLLPSMPRLETAASAGIKVNGHNGFCGSPAKKHEQSPIKFQAPVRSQITSPRPTNGVNCKPSNGLNTLGKHAKSLVPYGSDESDNENGDARQPADGVVKTKAGVWTVEQQSASQQVAPSLRGRTENCAAKSSSNSPTVDERSATVNHLLKMSHQGYGAPVATWNGEKTEIEKEVIQERREDRKRQHEEDRELDMDRGRTKKIKTYRPDERKQYHNGFQDYQNRENAHHYRSKWLSDQRHDRDRDRHYYNSRGQNKNYNNSKQQKYYSGGGNKYNKRPFHHNRHYNQRESNGYHRR